MLRPRATVCRRTGSRNQLGPSYIPLSKYDCVRLNTSNTIGFRAWSIGPNWFRLPVPLHTVLQSFVKAKLNRILRVSISPDWFGLPVLLHTVVLVLHAFNVSLLPQGSSLQPIRSTQSYLSDCRGYPKRFLYNVNILTVGEMK